MEIHKQYRTAKWQEKRLEVFSRDKFICRCCGSDFDLQVHHLYYKPKTSVWDYDLDGLVTVCAKCHEALTFELPKLSGIIAFRVLSEKIDLIKLDQLLKEATI